MGLDMYLYKKKYLGSGSLEGKMTTRRGEEKNIKIEDSDYIFTEHEVGYFRKANQIHNWIVQNLGDPDADYKNVEMEIGDIRKLRDVCREVAEKAKITDGLIHNGTIYGNQICGDVWLLEPEKGADGEIKSFTRTYVLPLDRVNEGEYFETGADGKKPFDDMEDDTDGKNYYQKSGDHRYEQYFFGDKIANLKEIAALLPTVDGFFFGSTDYDKWYLDQVKQAIEIFDDIIADYEDEIANGVEEYDITYIYSVSY